MNLRNLFNRNVNPMTFDEGLLARYPNNTKLVDTKKTDENGNTQMIMTEDGVLISEEKFSGVVYVNETTFEVFSGNRLEKTGLFKIGFGTNWNIETPRQIVNKAHVDFKEILERKIKEIEPNCLCSYPRITDYLNRNATESVYISGVLRHSFLQFNNSKYDMQTEVETSNYNCKVCNSEFEWKYKERGIDKLTLIKNKLTNKIGKESEIEAPNFIEATNNNAYCKQSSLFRDKLFESDLNGIINYFFAKK